MNFNPNNGKAKLGPSEWVKILGIILPLALGACTWFWRMSDRMLLLETSSKTQTEILKRLDDEREVRAVRDEQLRQLISKVDKLEAAKQ